MRRLVKTLLSPPAPDSVLPGGGPSGTSLLIYHRVSGTSPDELDVNPGAFAMQVSHLTRQNVVGLDDAAAALDRGETEHSVVLTFDDGFRDVYDNAWPLLKRHRMPFTIYLTTGYVGGEMRWEGSTAKEQGAPALTWANLREMVDSGLCTIGNHTHTHVRPEELTVEELDECTERVRDELGVTPRHFAYTWGVPVPAMEGALRERFATSATGELGRNLPGQERMLLKRVPVRRTDPLPFFKAKFRGRLVPERTYGAIVGAAKRAGVRG